MKRMLLTLCVLAPCVLPSLAQAQRPNLVPPGWTQDFVDPQARVRRFISPDGLSWFIARQTPADRNALARDMDEVAYRGGEEITYLRRGRSWIAVSGYAGDRIFYRKSNLACSGTRWHHIELFYPRERKRAMDATVTHIARAMTAYADDCGPGRQR